jgi:hypothetical protein
VTDYFSLISGRPCPLPLTWPARAAAMPAGRGHALRTHTAGFLTQFGLTLTQIIMAAWGGSVVLLGCWRGVG